MNSSSKNAMAVVVGLLSSMIVLTLLETLSAKLFPLPANVDLKNPDAVIAAIHNMPVSAMLLQLANYFIASFIGGLVATKISKAQTSRNAIVLGGILTFLGLVNSISLGEPVWMAVASFLMYIPGALFGFKVGKEKEKI
jgi:hypothetical protein